MLHKSRSHLRQKVLRCSVFEAFEQFRDYLRKSTNLGAKKNLCSTSHLVSNEISLKPNSHLVVHLYILFLGIRFIRKLAGKKSCNTTNHWQEHFELKPSIPYFAFNEVPLMSKSHLRLVLHLF